MTSYHVFFLFHSLPPFFRLAVALAGVCCLQDGGFHGLNSMVRQNRDKTRSFGLSVDILAQL